MIDIQGVSKTFAGKQGPVHALQNVSIHVEKGDIYGIIGFSGAGKSTLIRMVNRLETPDCGTVTVDGRQLRTLTGHDLRVLRRKIGMVFQQFNLLEAKTVYHNVAMPLILAGAPKEKIAQRVQEVLHFVELDDKRDAFVSQLSGGQKQRVGIARALATDPDILLCDEATSALDPQTTESILALLRRVNREMGVTILLITHQMTVIQMICNKVAVMENGRVAEQGNVLDVFGSPQTEVAKRFVRTVISDQIPASIVDIARSERRHNCVERLKFAGKSVEQPVISQVCRIPDLEVNIFGATVQELQDTVMCVYILQLIGPDAAIEEAERFIDASGTLRERVEV